MAKGKCKDCDFYEAQTICVRYPPVVTVMGSSIGASFPRVDKNDQCGEFAPKALASTRETEHKNSHNKKTRGS